MILKLLISSSILTLFLDHVTATSCHELQQSQFNALNERLNQMIETITTLLPKSLKQLTPPAPRSTVSSFDYISPPTYSTSPPIPNLMYLAPPYPPISTAMTVTPTMNPNLITAPFPNMLPTAERSSQPQYSAVPAFAPQPSVINYQYLPQYANPAPAPRLTSSSYPTGPYPLTPFPYSLEYAQPHLVDSLSAPTYPNFSAYMPGLPLFPVPVQMPPGTYIPTYPPLPEVPQRYV